MNALDLVLLLVLFVVMPLYGVRHTRRLQAQVAAGEEPDRLRSYATTIATQWILVALAVPLWLIAGRSLPDLGLTIATGTMAWIGAGLGVAACVLLVVQMISVLRSPEKTGQLRSECGSTLAFLPHSERDERAWAAVSVTAGICEEILYRGFAIGVLAQVTGTWGAVAITSLAFGLGHAYQGMTGFAKTAAYGLAMAGLYVLSGSLWVPMLVHMVTDLTSGHLVRRSLEMAPSPTPVPAGSGAC